MRRYLLIIAALPLVLGSCHHFFGKRVRGNGNVKTEERQITAFKNLQVSASINVYVSQGDLKAVKIEGDENLLAYIEVLQEGDDLIIKNREGYNLDSEDGLKVFVTSPSFHSINLSGAGDIIGENKITITDQLEVGLSGAGDIKMEVDVPTLTANISGVGSLYLKGQTKDVDMDISGAGSAHCYELLSENMKIGISGVGSAEVYASVKLNASVSGAGSVNYKGNASDVSQNVSGVGSVHKE